MDRIHIDSKDYFVQKRKKFMQNRGMNKELGLEVNKRELENTEISIEQCT